MENKEGFRGWKYGIIGFIILEFVVWTHRLFEYAINNLPFFPISVVESQILSAFWLVVLVFIIIGWCISIGYLSKKLWNLFKVELRKMKEQKLNPKRGSA